MRRELLERLLRCPRCRSELSLDERRCTRCGEPFTIEGGIVDFLDRERMRAQQGAEIDLHESLASDYDDRYGHDFAEAYSRYWNEQYLSRLPTGCEWILDCGCGTGDLLRDLGTRSRYVVGADISPAMLLRAQRQLADPERGLCVATPGEELPFADASFDAVCYRGALHHMADEVAALREAHRVLAPRGLLLLSEPNDDSWILRLPRRIANRSLKRFGNQHKAFRSRPWLETIRSIGFVVTHTKYFSFLSQPLCGMSDLLPIMKLFRDPLRVARGLVSFDEACSRVPLLRRQSFDLFVVARKG